MKRIFFFLAYFLFGNTLYSEELKTTVNALAYNLSDLTYPVLDISGKVEDLEAKVEALKRTETELEVKFELSGDVLFDFDKADIRKEAEATLEQVASQIREFKKPKVTIDGYTDSKGDDSYNLKLSKRRADSVKTWLSGRKAEGSYSTKGLGEAKPIAPNTNPDGSDNPEGRQKNRRVEITVKKN